MKKHFPPRSWKIRKEGKRIKNLSDVRKPGVLYPSSLFCVFSPVLCVCRGDERTPCRTAVLAGRCGLGTMRGGTDGSQLPCCSGLG